MYKYRYRIIFHLFSLFLPSFGSLSCVHFHFHFHICIDVNLQLLTKGPILFFFPNEENTYQLRSINEDIPPKIICIAMQKLARKALLATRCRNKLSFLICPHGDPPADSNLINQYWPLGTRPHQNISYDTRFQIPSPSFPAKF